ncbi:MAG: hypothetical protein CFH05_01027 [Alphaproteobacteria bacterium MarineAlpha3_Bin4]|nr:MAG: hypothetical protein CFH05_01027 [Alphaproteobacteria bacterium MarineAlpha3_Bin4]
MVAPHLLIAEVDPFEDVALTQELIFLPPLWVHVVIGGAPVAITMTLGILRPLEEALAGSHDQFRSNEERPRIHAASSYQPKASRITRLTSVLRWRAVFPLGARGSE